MKSTYKLYGSFWDGRSIPEKTPPVLLYDENLDYEFVVLTEVLMDEIPKTADKDNQLKKIALLIDYTPENNYKCIWDFFILRLLQIANYYDAYIFCDGEGKLIILRKWLDDYYKRKTPQEQLAPSCSAFPMIC